MTTFNFDQVAGETLETAIATAAGAEEGADAFASALAIAIDDYVAAIVGALADVDGESIEHTPTTAEEES